MCETNHVYICHSKSHAAAVLAYMRTCNRFDGCVSFPCLTIDEYITYTEVSDVRALVVDRLYVPAPIVYVATNVRPSQVGFWHYRGQYLFCDENGMFNAAVPSVTVTASKIADVLGELAW